MKIRHVNMRWAAAAIPAALVIALVAGCSDDNSCAPVAQGPDLERTFVQIERLGNPLVSEVTLAKREHGHHNAVGPAGDVAAFSGQLEEFVTTVAGRSSGVATTLSSVLLPDELVVNTSKDGATASFRKDLPQLRSLAFGNGVFVAVGEGVIVTSRDGKEWAKEERAGDKLDWISWTGKEFLCGGGKSTLASADGRSWQARDFKPQGKPLWTDGTRFITSSWPGKMAFSPDGKTWQASPQLTPNGINTVVRAEAK